ncbi:hypothetical protein G4B88_026364, partial [Cannabis sativa]
MENKSKIQILYDACSVVFTQNQTPNFQQIQWLKSLLGIIEAKDVGIDEFGISSSSSSSSLCESSFSNPNKENYNKGLICGLTMSEITYIHIHECNDFSIGVFCFPAGGTFPLHDHPGMTVFSKLLYGSLYTKAYDWVIGLGGLVREEMVNAPTETSILFPNCGGNIHTFTAITPCAILDVLTPPYSDDLGRPSTYYFDILIPSLPGYSVLEERELPDDLVVAGAPTMERYEIVKDIGSGNLGVARLVRDKGTRELFAVKFIERGQKQICHRDLKLENTLLDGSTAPRVKICDFGYSKSSVLHSQPKSTVGTPAYIAPEVLSKKEYDGKIADVWSCGVTLYVMLVGAYPFEDPEDPRNFTKTIGRILSVHYSIPDYVRISLECKHLLSRVFVANPEKRITIPEIKNHPWFLRNLPIEFMEGGSYQSTDVNNPSQSIEEVVSIIHEASKVVEAPKLGGGLMGGSMDLDDLDIDADVDIDIETS